MLCEIERAEKVGRPHVRGLPFFCYINIYPPTVASLLSLSSALVSQ